MSTQHPDDPWDDHNHSQRRKIPAVPDLRFEQSYLRSVRPYVRVEHIKSEELAKDEKGKAIASAQSEHGQTDSPEVPSRTVIRTEENIDVQWASVLWVTTRDQILSPFLQGALWGIAGHYLQPAFAILRSRLGAWWSRGDVYNRRGPRVEGKGVTQLRNWVGEIKQGKPMNTTFAR